MPNFLGLKSSTCLVSLICLAGFGCAEPEQIDYGSVCVTAAEVDGEHQLVVEADSQDCAGDHEGASFECSVSADGSDIAITTVFQDGKDPNDACAPPLTATCTITVEPGNYSLHFDDESTPLAVPSDKIVCLSGGSPPDDDTGG